MHKDTINNPVTAINEDLETEAYEIEQSVHSKTHTVCIISICALAHIYDDRGRQSQFIVDKTITILENYVYYFLTIYEENEEVIIEEVKSEEELNEMHAEHFSCFDSNYVVRIERANLSFLKLSIIDRILLKVHCTSCFRLSNRSTNTIEEKKNSSRKEDVWPDGQASNICKDTILKSLWILW